MRDERTLGAAADRLERRLTELAVLPGNPRILVGLSGGADSVFLLSALARLAPSRGISLFALHVEHGIRGDESLSDATLCRSICDRLGIALTVVSLDVPNEAKRAGEGIEECARRLRYDALEREREKLGCDYIAVAHHAGDQAETVLWHLLRGSGAKGLFGMAPLRGRILRPLLDLSGDEIRATLDAEGIDYAVDSTNADLTYTRNFLRRRVLPVLGELTPDPVGAICRASALLRRDLSCLDRMAEDFASDPRRCYDRDALRALERPILARVLMILAARAGGEMPSLSHLDLAADKIGETGVFKVSFPSSLTLCIGRDKIAFLRTEQEPYAERELVLGENPLPERGARLFLFASEKDISQTINVYKKSIKAVVSFDKIIGNLSVRQAKPGDAYRYGGMRREVKKIFASRRLADDVRRRIPIVCDDKGIVWIPGFGIREGCEAKEGAPSLWLLYVTDDCDE